MSYIYSTASTKSSCLTLALVALTSSRVSASSSLFESATIIKRGRAVLDLPSMSSGSTSNNRRNTSMYYYGDEDDESNLLDLLPRELAAMIESAESSKPSSAPTMSSSLRYYPTYTEGGESCSAKSSSEFSSWEVSYDSLHECCNESFDWDYDACINSHAAEHEDENDLLEMLPRELAAMIESASTESSSPSSAPTLSSSIRYYPTYTEGGESCSTKSAREFNSWEVSYDSLHECCNESFGWDYDACIINQ